MDDDLSDKGSTAEKSKIQAQLSQTLGEDTANKVGFMFVKKVITNL